MPDAADGTRHALLAATLPPLEAASAHVQALAQRGLERRYRRGALIIQEGERGNTLYIVRSGRLRAFVADASGKELTLGLYGPGEYVGEMSLDSGPRSASVEATEATVCTLIPREQLLGYIAERPDFALDAPTPPHGTVLDHPALLARLQRPVDRANSAVARAEQVRRFTVLLADTTASSPLITPTLKLRRDAFLAAASEHVDALYGTGGPGGQR